MEIWAEKRQGRKARCGCYKGARLVLRWLQLYKYNKIVHSGRPYGRNDGNHTWIGGVFVCRDAGLARQLPTRPRARPEARTCVDRLVVIQWVVFIVCSLLALSYGSGLFSRVSDGVTEHKPSGARSLPIWGLSIFKFKKPTFSVSFVFKK